MEILARLPQGCEVNLDDFVDITTVPVTSIGWTEDGRVCITFEQDLTTAEQLAVLLRVTSSDSADEARRVAAAAFLTVDAPTAAQTLAQVKRLTRILLTLDDGT